MRHIVSIAAAVFVRGSLAFLYYPLLGEVSASAKYGHNVVMLTTAPGSPSLPGAVSRDELMGIADDAGASPPRAPLAGA